MKKTLAFFALLAAFGSWLPAQDISVPDLETRIANTGNAIPETALPVVETPPVTPLPVAVPDAATVLPSSEEMTVPAMDPVVPSGENGSVVSAFNQPAVTGWLDLGAGGPGSLYGDVSLFRESGAIPGFSADFRYDSADGYGVKKAGTGYFDRSTRLAARLFSETAENAWTVSFGLLDRTDGFQGQSAVNTGTSFGLSRRDISWNTGLEAKRFFANGFSAALGFAGSVFSAAAAPLEGHDGYVMTPRASIGYEYGAFSSEAHGFYGYETSAGEGEFHSGNFGLDLRYGWRMLVLEAGVSALGDSEDGLVVPFRLTLSLDRTESFLHSLSLSGGLTADRNSSRLLAEDEPFAAPGGLPVYASDWTGSAGLTVAPSEVLSVHAETAYRTTAFGRGTLVLLDERDANGLVPYVREERDSLVTKAAAAWTASGSELTAGYTGEWLDRLYRTSVHTVDAGFRVFDTTDERLWEASVKSAFALDHAEIPRVVLKGTVSPAANFALSLSFTDILPLALGEQRLRNGLYASRSGELVFAARLDF